jgi:hypothetical protein
VEILVKPPNTPDFSQPAHSASEINPVLLPVYPIELDILDLEAKKFKKRSLQAALFVFLEPKVS